MKMNKILALIYTVFPGANRVMLFFIAAKIMNISAFSDFSVAYSFAVIISMVGAIGVGTLIIKNEINLSLLKFIRYIFIAIYISLPVFLVSFFSDDIKNQILGIILLSIGLSANQIYRNEIILSKKFAHGILYEASLMIFSILSVVLFCTHSIYYISTVYILFSLVFKKIESKSLSNDYINIKQAGYISYSNLISSGILYFLPIMSSSLSTVEVTKVVSLLVSVIGIVSVFPRALFNLKIKEIKNNLERKKTSQYKYEIKKYRLITSFIMILSVIAVSSYMFIMNTGIDYKYVFIFIMLVSIFIYIGQISIPETTMINMIGYEKYSLLLNLMIFLFFTTTYLILKVVNVSGSFLSLYILCLSIIFGYLFRAVMINIKIKGYIKS